MDQNDALARLIRLLEEHDIRYCVIGGVAVNAYAEPLVSLDLDLVVATEQLEQVEELLREHFQVRVFPHSLDLSLPGSDLRAQIQTDPRYGSFVVRASRRLILGEELPVASLEDVLQGKIWAIQDPDRRASKRQKDLADIARLLDAHPGLRSRVPPEVLNQLL